MTSINKHNKLSRDKQQSSRGKASFSTLIDPEKYRSLRLLSVQIDVEIKDLIDEALDLLLVKYADSIPKPPKRT